MLVELCFFVCLAVICFFCDFVFSVFSPEILELFRFTVLFVELYRPRLRVQVRVQGFGFRVSGLGLWRRFPDARVWKCRFPADWQSLGSKRRV